MKHLLRKATLIENRQANREAMYAAASKDIVAEPHNPIGENIMMPCASDAGHGATDFVGLDNFWS